MKIKDKCRIFVRQLAYMAKNPKQGKATPPKVEEPLVPYVSLKKTTTIVDYSFKKLKKIMDSVPFTQVEWSNMLHLSERTLQRYAKNNSSFEGIYTDRIFLLQEMIKLGLETFHNSHSFYQWLKKDKVVLGHRINFESLYSERGIQEVVDQISRIQYGVYT